jgi:hypothetical protein
MIKKTMSSFTDGINQKLKNPFLGTFMMVWTIRNWEFIYSLFYFDSKLSLDKRIQIIKNYFIDYSYAEVFITIGITFVVLIVTYVLLNLSSLIVSFFEKIITPQIYQLTDKSSVVVKSVYNEALERIELLNSKVQSEIDLKLQTKNENEKLENKIKELLAEALRPTEEEEVIDIFNRIREDEKLKLAISILQSEIQKGSPGLVGKVSSIALPFFLSNNLIESKTEGMLSWTDKGTKLNELMINKSTWDD